MPIELDDIRSGYNLSKINSNFQKIEDAWDEKLDRLVNDQGNQMEQQLDMNSNKIINHPPTDLEEPTDLVRVDALSEYGDFTGAIPVVASYTGNGVQTAFPKPVNANDARTFQVYIGGLRQEPYTDYFITDTSVVFQQAPVLDVSVDIYGYNPVLLENSAPVYADPILANFVGDGTTTTFFVSAAGSSTDACFISIDGVNQTPFTDFTNAGGAIQFTEAPPLNSEIFVRIFAPFVPERLIKTLYLEDSDLSDTNTPTQNRIALQSFIDNAPDKSTIIGDGNSYDISGSILINDKTLFIRWAGTSLTQVAESKVIDYNAGLDFTRNVTSVDSASRTISVDTSDIKVGDVLKLISDDKLPGTRPAVGAADSRMGQFVTVDSISVGSLVVNESIRYSYNTNIRLSKLSGHTLHMFDSNFTYLESVTGLNTCVDIRNAVLPVFERNQFGNLPFIGISLRGCYGYLINKPSFFRSKEDAVNTGHGISDWSCFGGRCLNPISNHVRHTWDNNQQPVEVNSSEIEHYGPTYGFICEGGVGTGFSDATFNTHHGAEDGIISNCIVTSNPNSGGLSIRGRRITARGIKIREAVSGSLLFSEIGLDSSDYSEDIHIFGLEVTAVDDLALQIQRVNRCKIFDPILNTKNFNSIAIIDSDVSIYRPTIVSTGNTSATQSLITLTDSALSIHDETQLRITNHTGSAARFVSYIGNSSFRCDNVNVISNDTLDIILFNNAGATDPTYASGEINFITGPTSFTLQSGSFDDEASYVKVKGTVGDNQWSFTTYSDASTVSFNNSGHKQIMKRVNANSPITIGGIVPGKFPGQQITLKSSTANAITIPDGLLGNGVEVENVPTGNKILNGPRQFVTYQWSDNKWTDIGSVIS